MDAARFYKMRKSSWSPQRELTGWKQQLSIDSCTMHHFKGASRVFPSDCIHAYMDIKHFQNWPVNYIEMSPNSPFLPPWCVKQHLYIDKWCCKRNPEYQLILIQKWIDDLKLSSQVQISASQLKLFFNKCVFEYESNFAKIGPNFFPPIIFTNLLMYRLTQLLRFHPGIIFSFNFLLTEKEKNGFVEFE